MYKETLVPYLNQGHTPSAEYIFGSLMRPTLQVKHQNQVKGAPTPSLMATTMPSSSLRALALLLARSALSIHLELKAGVLVGEHECVIGDHGNFH
jgi:hypothetical protein